MSSVTNLILHIGIIEDEDAKIKEVNAFFGERENPLVGLREQPLPRGWYGGSKYLECNIYVGAFNYLDLVRFLKHINSIQWDEPQDVQLFVKEQNDTRFKLIHGVEEFDNRVYPLNQMASDADELLEDVEKLIIDEEMLREVRLWRQHYKDWHEEG